MINRILVKTEPSRATKIEIKRIIDAHNAKPKPQRQCQVCGTWIEQGDICCDETEYTNRIQQDDDDPRTLSGDCD